MGLKFGTVLADPPWPERGGGKVKRGADRHYKLMTVEQIAALDVASIVQDNAHLYLWSTNNHLPDALTVMRAWGFRYVTNLAWGKVHDGNPQQGLGQYFRGAHELLLFGVRGRPGYRKTVDGKRAQAPSLHLAPRGRHSEKPAVFHDVARRVSPGPYVELFARSPRIGWECWGNEVKSTVTMVCRETMNLVFS